MTYLPDGGEVWFDFYSSTGTVANVLNTVILMHIKPNEN